MTKNRYNFGKNYRGYQGYAPELALVARIAKIYKLPIWAVKGDVK